MYYTIITVFDRYKYIQHFNYSSTLIKDLVHILVFGMFV